MVFSKPGVDAPVRPETTDPALVRWLMRQCGREEEHTRTTRAVQAAFERTPSLRPKEPNPERPVQPALLARLRCPDCAGALDDDGTAVTCRACGEHYPRTWGTAYLHFKWPRLSDPPIETTLSRLCGDDVRRRAIVARVIRRLRRNETPAGPLRRALWQIENALGIRSPGDAH